MGITGTIFHIQKFCIHDGDGIRTNVFFKGCPLRCLWCHNPEGLSRQPSLMFYKNRCTACGRCLAQCPARSRMPDGTIALDRTKCTLCGQCVQLCLQNANERMGKTCTAEEVFEEVMQDRIFYESSGGGITLSGGEPSMQPDFALALLTMAKEAGIGRAMETCGIGSREFYEAAAACQTVFLYDLKCMDSARHRALTGVENGRILENLQNLFRLGADVILRIPLIPGCNDSTEDLQNLSDFLIKNKGKYRYAEIMPYHTMGTGKSHHLGDDNPFCHDAAGAEDIARWTTFFAQAGVSVRVSE